MAIQLVYILLMSKLLPYTRFSPSEDKILNDHYEEMGAAQLSRSLLSNRTSAQIASRAAHIGLSVDPSIIGLHVRNTEDLTHLIEIKDPFVAYMYGFLWADGCVNKRTFHVKLKITDTDFADIKDRWLTTAKSWRYSTYHDGNLNHSVAALAEINHQLFHAFLVQCGYLFKSGDSADEVLKRIPDHLKHYWWRGYFDGDGGFTVSGKTRRVTITSCYEQDWAFFIELAKQLDISYSIRRGYHRGAGRSNVFLDAEACLVRFMEYIYQGEPFGLKRKKQAYDDYVVYKQTIRPNKTSRYRGVCINRKKRGGWLMQIYKGHHVRQYYKTELEAAHAYDKLALEFFGNKAILNFPKAV